MSKVHDLTGMKFNRLKIIERAENNKYNRSQWLCKCDCGNTIVVSGNALLKNNTKSCGCLRDESCRKSKNKTHGMADTRIFHCWSAMKDRCYNKHNPAYKNYGGRGVTVCDEWLHDFQAFYDWSMAHGYIDDLTIDRKDVNGNYCPENCRWITKDEQARNKRTNRYIEYNGERKTIAEWARISGIDRSILRGRIDRGWSMEKAMSTPSGSIWSNRKKITFNGKTHTIPEWAKIIGINGCTLRDRLTRRGWSVERALTEPVEIHNKHK